MYLERRTQIQIERFLLAGSLATFAFGLALLISPGRILEWGGFAAQPTFFVRFSGMTIALFGAAYVVALMDREPNRGMMILGFAQKFGAVILFVIATALGLIPNVMYVVAAVDGLMAVLFLFHIQTAGRDGWS